jgi:hypothetical protein
MLGVTDGGYEEQMHGGNKVLSLAVVNNTEK